jgi:V/A-type H+-transporting ATPase subunit I
MEADGPIAYISGYVPTKELDALKAAAKAGGWGLMALDPADDELPPTKVENGPIVRIINPVFQFLGTVPNYREYDISAPFLIFFSLFFAMIFGDAAYGSIMLALGVYAAIRAKAKGGRVPDAIRLLLVIATTTVAWGAATATWFAIPVEKLPSFLRAIAVPYIMSGNPNADANVKIFCFIVGAVQLAFAHLKNIKRDFPNPKFLAQVGSLSLVIGMFCAVLNLVVDPSRFPIPSWALYLIGGGFLLVFVFGNWNGNLLKSIVEGLKGIIPTFLGTVSVFADIVSYIRLWAVGLAGLAISQTVNGMAGGLFKAVIGILFGVILLVVGHSLNLAMSVLSVVVHGIRLNTLEFSSHLGMEWSGYRYDPFRETVTEDSAD